MKDHVVVVESEVTGACDPADGSLETRIVERLDLAALAADEVMVVFAARVSGLEASDAISEVDSMHELHVGELIEYAVDACQTDGATLGPELVEEFLCREAATLHCKLGDDRLARGSRASAGATEFLARVAFPARFIRGRHSSEW